LSYTPKTTIIKLILTYAKEIKKAELNINEAKAIGKKIFQPNFIS